MNHRPRKATFSTRPFLFRRLAGDSRPPRTFPATSSLRVPSRNSMRWQAVKSEVTGKASPLIVWMTPLSSSASRGGRAGRRRRPIHGLMAERPRKRASARRSYARRKDSTLCGCPTRLHSAIAGGTSATREPATWHARSRRIILDLDRVMPIGMCPSFLPFRSVDRTRCLARSVATPPAERI